ncbi:R-spondin-4 [Austrofundulus limnaeus]|uniref:R-spondin-4 n=1 Tax=Austrofundulus limnaeus TaxID=52670 RepID=A0A2I4BSW8_AUSLI|nr:PREDICTED: R-spondin-2-like [Austrofundulus limnaeus]
MHLRLLAFVMSFLCEVVRVGSGVLQKQSAPTETSGDRKSCLECSKDNGCIRCQKGFVLFLQRKGMSHHGTCLQLCPAGHFEQKGRDGNHCMKCRSSDCEHCFSRDFCTKCKVGFQLHKGKCLTRCPEGTIARQADCSEDCPPAARGAWSEWSVCARDGATCGFRWGKQTRTREGVQPDKDTSLCPSESETQRCRMKKKCPTERKQNKNGGLGRKKERKRRRQLAVNNASVSSNATTDRTAEPGEP